MSQWAMHRDERTFEDPLSFRPERWLDGLASRLPRFAYFPFGGGPRVCIGNHFARLEAILGLATLVSRLQWEAVGDDDLRMLPAVTLRPVSGVHLRARPRPR
jgi:cytochrome P450